MRRKLAVLFAVLAMAALLAACGQKQDGTVSVQKIKRKAVASEEIQFTTPHEGDTIAVFDTTAGEVRAVLYESLAPQACENFIGLVQQGYYNGLAVTRVSPGFCVEAGLDAQGGSTTIWGTSGYPAEVTDRLHHYSGALCAAMSDAGTGGSVFYFMQTLPDALSDELVSQMTENGWRAEVIEAYGAGGGAPYLDYTDTVFGQVYSGMEVVDTIAQSAADENETPIEPILLNSVTITTYAAQ